MSADANFVAYPSTPAFKTFRTNHVKRLRETRPEIVASPSYRRLPARAKFLGTVKLHGTNATVIFNDGDSSTERAQFQSRSRVIDAKTDNGGTVAHLSQAPLHELVAQILAIRGATTFRELMIAGEVAGVGIQKGVAIACVPRLFAIFNIRIDGAWVDMRRYASVSLPEHRIFNVVAWPTYEIDIDLAEDPRLFAAQMKELTDAVTAACPVGAVLAHEVQAGKSGQNIFWAGEGIVWTMVESLEDGVPFDASELLNFKTKGAEFETTTHVPWVALDADAIVKAAAFAQYALAERRFEQGIEFVQQELVHEGKADESPYQMRLIPKFARWVVDDAVREEKDKMEEMNVDEKLARNAMFEAAKKWYISKVHFSR